MSYMSHKKSLKYVIRLPSYQQNCIDVIMAPLQNRRGGSGKYRVVLWVRICSTEEMRELGTELQRT
jgi:hypothetical protein